MRVSRVLVELIVVTNVKVPRSLAVVACSVVTEVEEKVYVVVGTMTSLVTVTQEGEADCGRALVNPANRTSGAKERMMG